MGRLIDQFCEAAARWSREPGRDPEYIVWRTFLCTGGDGRYERVGRVNTSDLAPEEVRKLTYSQLHGHNTLEQMKGWLERLAYHERIKEDFLIAALVRDITGDLQEMVDQYEERAEQGRQKHQGYREMLDDPAFRTGPDGGTAAPSGPATRTMKAATGPIQLVVDAWSDETFMVSESEKARLEADAAAWQWLTAPIMRRDNLRCGEREWFQRIAR